MNPILITGGAQRIGLHLARSLLEQGRSVAISYRTRHPAVDELEAAGALCLPGDFATDQGVLAFIEQLKGKVTGLRAIIHNASSWQSEGPLEDAPALFDAMMQIHAKAPYLINRHLAPLLDNGDKPADIIHITDYVVEKGSAEHTAYVASKAALENLTLSFAQALAPGVKVNSIAPSLIIFNEDDSEDYRQKTLAKSVMGIEPGCQEISSAVRYLLDSHYVTGRTLKVDGGRHIR
ncbi:dihydromonapterin reductase [Gallaecimonas sp. GXIMD4217]|uniref:dihydromonapterin reductase n=1 Tax=Gallaecimonas sp. GXIMD4217 TaxID=3131927 RepID=UPI00311AE0DD